jgi:predicted 2-oxoglutarate/Fe(II)-dependent dioxygenase YbiX
MVMQHKELAPGILVYSEIIKDPTSLIKEIEDSVDMKAISWQQAYVKSENNVEVDTSTRDTQVIGVPYFSNEKPDLSSPTSFFLNTVSKLFYNSFNKYEEDYKSYHGLSTTWHDSFSILKYSIGQKFTNHVDDHKDYIRRVSTVYYMNDNYSGGEINFPRFNISYKPKENNLLIFPSNFMYNHSVSEVTEGTRYAVVSWLQ